MRREQSRAADRRGRPHCVYYATRFAGSHVAEVRYGGADGELSGALQYDAGDGDNLGGRLVAVSANSAPWNIRTRWMATRCAFAGHFRRIRPPSKSASATTTSGRSPLPNIQDGARIDYRYHPNGLLAAIPGFVEAVEYDAAGRRTRVLYRQRARDPPGLHPR